MAGIYIHIPYCRKACHYCDFHFSTNLSHKPDMVEAINNEIFERKNYLQEDISTIYFGGGTPSLLTSGETEQILNTIHKHFTIEESAEITLEANPEDLTREKTLDLLNQGINRLSIGVQTLNEERLAWLNRAHTKFEVYNAFDHARDAGFNNISLDLIYAIPEENESFWKSDLDTIVGLNPEHVSLYGLTIEERTVFGNWKEKNKLTEIPEEIASEQYLHAIDHFKKNEYIQYEVSNFGKPGFDSKHNGAYWDGKHYLGIGPGAHSFDGKSRRYNIRNNVKYIRNQKEGDLYYEEEILSSVQKTNEKILIQLRRMKGLDLSVLKNNEFANRSDENNAFIEEILRKELAVVSDNYLKLLPKGFLVADEIALRLFFDE